MPIVNSIAASAEEMKTWRRHLHQHPELGLDCFKTAAFVVERLKEFGVTEIHEGIARSGVVAIIEGRAPGRTIGLRADMDALPMEDLSGTEHASTVPGMAHTCGHDGHTTMLLGAAKYLAETRNFAGRVALLFQPAEENEGGGRIMVEEGVMDRFDIAEVYGIHNMPGGEVGSLVTNHGALLAGVDEFTVTLTGKGGHAAEPQETVDPVVAAASLTMALQTILGRNLAALDRVVVSVTQIHTGSAMNIVPETAVLNGTVRYYDKDAQTVVKARMAELAEFQARSFGCTAELDYEEGYPPTINHPEQAAFAARVAREVVGADKVDDDTPPIMPGEDFSYMLQARPGAYLFLGQGETAVCHHPEYDFNDDIAPVGASFFARLIETALPVD
ncbi:M20 aminoacylase family protein [Sagittula sp. SSi028]|uniref:M20 aminoacylase family protein n=1 Tax=Sagittula sp. SSi028 TaxID=3400636 RepID=UPI003AF81C97